MINLRKCVNRFLILNSGRLSYSNLGEYEFTNNDYSTSFKILTFADDKKARKIDLQNIGKDLRTSIEKHKLKNNGEG
jgi:hypothetical protein